MSFSATNWIHSIKLMLVATICAGGVSSLEAQNFVPGTGKQVDRVGDTFEDENWQFILNLPKASRNIDGQTRGPAGTSRNRRVLESTYRGTADVVKRVPTPPGGIEGSKGALLMQSKVTGIPGRPSNEMQQDDMIFNVKGVLGRVATSRNPSVVVRVYLPPFDEWEERNGSHFGFRAETTGMIRKEVEKKVGLFRRKTVKNWDTVHDAYWPGFFIQFNRKEFTGQEKDSATLLVRGDKNGHEIVGRQMDTGWWTLGMSFSGDGQVHYYARPGVEDLRAQDHITSQFPYSAKADYFTTFFFNIVNMDNGRTWSTKWIIDDPKMYLGR